MPLYEFRIRSRGATIWIVEHYCRDDIDALEKAETEFGVTVWRDGQPVARAESKQMHNSQRRPMADGFRPPAKGDNFVGRNQD